MGEKVDFEGGRVRRRYTKKWAGSGIINVDEIPELVRALVATRGEMVEYIEALHDKLDYVLQHNQCCDISSCLTAGCTSDHK